MSLLAEALSPRPRANVSVPSGGGDPLNGFWYTADPSGYVLDAQNGIAVTADTVMKCGTVLAAVRFRGDSWAMCPPSTFRKTAKGRAEDPTHYSQVVLRNPNRWMTGNRWRHLNGVWMATWGNAYSEILAGPRSFADELRPLHPSTIRVVDQRADGSLVYLHKSVGQDERRLGQERVLHFRDISNDGISGLAMYRMIRNVVSIALLAEKHQMTSLSKGSRIAGLLVPDKPLNPEQRKALKESVNQDLGGSNTTHTFGIMPAGVEFKTTAFTNRETQFAELDDHNVGAILRFLGVPGVVVNWADKTATYASAEAFFEQGGIKHCVLPILTNVEAEEEKSLLREGDGRQIKHNLDALLRSNTAKRYESLSRATGRPFMTGNEARAIEDLDRDDDPSMDKVLLPANMTTGTDDPGQFFEPVTPAFTPDGKPVPRPLPPAEEPEDDEEEDDARAARAARLFAQDAAARVVRRERAAVLGGNGSLGAARRYAKDADGWEKWADAYYEKHISHVMEALHIGEPEARAYCEAQRIALLSEGPAAVEKWESENVPRLVTLALGGEE